MLDVTGRMPWQSELDGGSSGESGFSETHRREVPESSKAFSMMPNMFVTFVKTLVSGGREGVNVCHYVPHVRAYIADLKVDTPNRRE